MWHFRGSKHILTPPTYYQGIKIQLPGCTPLPRGWGEFHILYAHTVWRKATKFGTTNKQWVLQGSTAPAHSGSPCLWLLCHRHRKMGSIESSSITNKSQTVTTYQLRPQLRVPYFWKYAGPVMRSHTVDWGQDRSETKRSVLVLVMCCETRSCHARRHNDIEGHSHFSGTIIISLFCAWNITLLAFTYLKVKSAKCLCLIPAVLVLEL